MPDKSPEVAKASNVQEGAKLGCVKYDARLLKRIHGDARLGIGTGKPQHNSAEGMVEGTKATSSEHGPSAGVVKQAGEHQRKQERLRHTGVNAVLAENNLLEHSILSKGRLRAVANLGHHVGIQGGKRAKMAIGPTQDELRGPVRQLDIKQATALLKQLDPNLAGLATSKLHKSLGLASFHVEAEPVLPKDAGNDGNGLLDDLRQLSGRSRKRESGVVD
eukprot:13433998-Alexandrium_andersonii.AAC.1